MFIPRQDTRAKPGARRRAAALVAALVLGLSITASAQRPADSNHVVSRHRLAAELAMLRVSGANVPIPADSFTTGNRLIPAGSTVHGSVGTAGGNLEISGVVDGSAVAIGGDVVVHRGGIVSGDAMTVGGKVVLDGGRVDGEMRSVSLPSHRLGLRVPGYARAPLTTWQAVKLAIGWFAVMAIIGLGVLIFAETNLDGVVRALEAGAVKAFWLGVLGQIAALPVLLLLVLALALTIIGILLIPFAIVAYVIALAGVVTMGFLAVSRLTGSAIAARSEGDVSARGVHVSALFLGLAIYFALWLAAAAFTSVPVAGDVLRGIALAVTWVAATAGLGAVLVSRAGTIRAAAGAASQGAALRRDELAWQTPTPITGVAAARRPAANRTEP